MKWKKQIQNTHTHIQENEWLNKLDENTQNWKKREEDGRYNNKLEFDGGRKKRKKRNWNRKWAGNI